MALLVHRAERADALVRGLAGLLAQRPPDPFTPDLVAVPSKGVERWIAQMLSATLGTAAEHTADGVCANVLFPSPGRVVAETLSAGTGVDPRDDPWAEARLAWAVLDVVDECAPQEWCTTLARHLGVGPRRVDRGRRVAVAQKLAHLFTRYGAERPQMVRAWLAGDDTDGFGVALDEDLRWQPELWRRVRLAVRRPSPAERLEEARDRLLGQPGLVDLPDRLSVFGPTRLSTEQLLVLDALAAHREVHLWLPHPSAQLWQRVAETCRESGAELTTRRPDPWADLPRHPMVRSCARDAREMQVRLLRHVRPGSDEHLDLPPGSPSLLAAIQRDVREDRPPSGDHAPAVADRSLQVHACHGRQRQVEVLREVVLGLLADDPSLELRDIVVMCPDIEAYAPLIAAGFGELVGEDSVDPTPSHPGHRLQVRLADRALRQTNSVLAVVARLLALADARLSVTEVLDLAAMPAVRARFGLDDESLERIADWARRSGVRWGLEAAARAPYHLDGIRQNTWQAGLDRLLLGVAMDEDDLRTLDVALPLDDVDGTEADLAGRFAELVDRLAATVAALGRRQSLTQWVEALLAAVDDLVDVPLHEDWQLAEARRQLAEATTSAGTRADTVQLGLSDVRALLATRLQGRPTRANFRTGHLTMCTMVPMRSVPHRVVCLLGLDDGVFPRGIRVDGDDVLSRSARVGERDPRSEDRQLFLDAVLAARERLVVLYTGADERTGVERPPAVPLGELLDVVDRTVAGDTPGRDRVLVRHPLQPFDARSFVAGELGAPGPFSFDTSSYAGAQALLAGTRTPEPRLTTRLPSVPPADVDLEDLVRFLESPARGFLRQRLQLTGTDEEEEQVDSIPVEVDALQQWAVGDRLLLAGLAGVPRDVAVRAERLRGDLPPGALGSRTIDPVARQVEALVDWTAGLRAGPRDAIDVAVDLGDGTRLFGTVAEVHQDRVVRVVYSRLGAKHRLRAWVSVLALAAAVPGRDWCAATVGRGRDNPTMSALTAPERGTARELLATLVRLHRDGLAAPAPLAPKTSCAYASQRHRGSPPKAAAVKAATEWRSTMRDGRAIGDGTEAESRRIWGDVELGALLGEPARTGEDHDDEPHRFGQLARQVFAPLLAAEAMHG